MCARAGGLGYFRNAGPSEQPRGCGFPDFGRSVNPIQSLKVNQGGGILCPSHIQSLRFNQGGLGGQIVPVTLLLAPVFVDLPTALGGMVLGDLHFTIDE